MPERGDIVWLEFDPSAGHKQRGRRPALVLSARSYNDRTSLAVMCPITSQVKGYPFEVELKGKKIRGAVLSDHLKNLDWRVRRAALIERVPTAALDEVTRKARLLIGA